MADENFTIETKFTVDNSSAIRNVDALDAKFDELRRDAEVAGSRVRSALSNAFPAGLGGNAFAGIKSSLSGVGGVVAGEAGKIAGSLSAIAPANGALTGLGAAAGPVGLAVAGVATALIGGAAAAGRYADDIDDAATSLNVTTGFLQKHSAAVVLAGGNSEAFEKSMSKLNVKIGDAATGNKSAVASFAAIGVSVTDAGGKIKNNEVVFDEVRAKLSGMESDTVRLAAANDLFGKGAKDMSGVLKMNAVDYDELIGQVSKYGVANDAAILAAGRMGDAGDLLGNAIKAQTINAFAPLTGALGEMAINALPMVGKGFQFLGGVIDVLSVPFSVIGDLIGLVWDLLKEGVGIVARSISSWGPFQGMLASTGDASDTFRDRFVNVLQTIVRGSTNMTAAVVGRFTELQAQIHNIGASIANFAVDAGLAGIFGIKGKIELVDPKAEAARAEAAIRAGGDKAIAYLDTKRAKPIKDRAAETGGTLAGYNAAAAGADKQSAAQKAAADAEKKFKEETEKLEAAIKDATRSVEDKTLADNLQAAGLSRDTAQIGAQADAIRTLTTRLLEAQKTKAIVDVTADLANKQREAAYTTEQLAQVEARRRAGLPVDLAITNQITTALDAQAVATLKATNAKAQAEKLSAVKKDIGDAKFDLENERDAKNDPVGAALKAQTKAIDDRRIARLKDIEAMGLEQEAQAALQAQINELAADETANAEMDAAQSKADALSERLTGMFTDAEATSKQFLADLVGGLVRATLQAILLNKTMAAGGGGGGFGGIISGALSSAFGFGGFRENGGSVSAGQAYVVGEKRPEVFVPDRSGTILPSTNMGGSSINMHAGNNTFVIQNAAGMNEQTLAGAMTKEQERMMTGLVRREIKNSQKGR